MLNLYTNKLIFAEFYDMIYKDFTDCEYSRSLLIRMPRLNDQNYFTCGMRIKTATMVTVLNDSMLWISFLLG